MGFYATFVYIQAKLGHMGCGSKPQLQVGENFIFKCSFSRVKHPAILSSSVSWA